MGKSTTAKSEIRDEVFFSILEREKHSDTVSFRIILEEIFRKTGRLEASFGSKLNCCVDRDDQCKPASMGPACPGQPWIEGAVSEPRHRVAIS